MSNTLSDLGRDVLSVRLGIVDAKKSPPAELQSRVERLYNQRYAVWALKDQAYWPQTSIPDEVIGGISRIIAQEMCAGLGMQVPIEPDEVTGQPTPIGVLGWRMLKRVLTQQSGGGTTRAEYF
jgi:hypothetical protein